MASQPAINDRPPTGMRYFISSLRPLMAIVYNGMQNSNVPQTRPPAANFFAGHLAVLFLNDSAIRPKSILLEKYLSGDDKTAPY
jgi:hypothetical protein